jgi:hypothetical protein
VDEPFAHLPDEITLSRDEVASVLEALDLGVAATRARAPALRQLRGAKLLLIAKLWPELGEILREPHEGER